MNLFENLIIFYFILSISVIFHEFFHFICAVIFKFKNIEVFIGDSFFSINIRNIHLSPLLVKAYVEFDYGNYSKFKIIIFYLSGSFANMLLILFGLLINNDYSIYFICINIFAVIVNMFPIRLLKNDLGCMLNYIDKERN